MDRIELLASLAEGTHTLADIGCDHAYTLITAIRKYGVKRGLAIEVAPGPFENARKNIEQFGLQDRIKLLLSDGFKQIQTPFDTALIAGMGGYLIRDILIKGIEKIKGKKLILSANSDVHVVRKVLMEQGFTIVDEVAFYDQGKYYEILVAVFGSSKMDEYDLKFGPVLRRKRPISFVTYYTAHQNKLLQVLPSIQNTAKKEEMEKEIALWQSLSNHPNMEKYYILNTPNYYRTYYLDDQMRPTIIVAPGGGYRYTSERESEPVVDVFHALGYHVIVVNYRETPQDAYPKPQQYLAEAVKQVFGDQRSSCLIGMGFSAGGHCFLETILHAEAYDLPPISLLILGYPVITTEEKYRHSGSFSNLLLDRQTDPILLRRLSLEKEVTKNNAPNLFLWGTFTDESVPVMNSLMLLEAYHQVGASVEYHCFPEGCHGLSVANAASGNGDLKKINPYVARWAYWADQWIKKQLEEK